MIIDRKYWSSPDLLYYVRDVKRRDPEGPIQFIELSSYEVDRTTFKEDNPLLFSWLRKVRSVWIHPLLYSLLNDTITVTMKHNGTRTEMHLSGDEDQLIYIRLCL